ncbi:TadE/TadG family type IV pilus assembly protein [Pseudomonas sp. R37(2017)]|uniref:TadE/TadG family type IV pilus assembly protein n=1 Tax=Pseudomonas sp. R37(2017) TaxID=1981685 RepID=UPI000A1FB45B|nr:TadE/TadG family type IV pilus assembly protein [Pseudomonas sp. R37(2017)]
MKASLPLKQKGAAAIEFALVFMIFFGVSYAIISYSLPLLLMQSFNQSTAEAERRSVGGLLSVRISYPTNKIRATIPFLNLPGIGQVPNLPATLTASASLQF